MLIEPRDIPVKVFWIVLSLLLTFCALVSVQNSLSVTYCNLELCPTKFDFVIFLATFIITGGFGLGIASLAYVTSKAMVKSAWKDVKFPENRI